MRSSDTQIQGTPKDYSSDLYRVTFEVAESNGAAKTILTDFLGPEHSRKLIALPHGYQCELPMQCIPELVRNLTMANIAVYQVIRHEQAQGEWQ
ncbi:MULTISPECIES: hypothetical protein [Ferrimonas]|uniref:hypothetical protein n=1 Tax=Ferrimonas TaxID=44011 RepID=UPI0004173983|nr:MULTISPECIES: hypothetical protein [Ferrimonas]USD37293.1 hypothetical protein J8Z22_20295 [Ferrimonas sp. SCSIO 43195]